MEDKSLTGWVGCWTREQIELGDCPNICEGDEDLLISRQRRILEKCCQCENFSQDLNHFRNSGHPLSSVISILHDDYCRQKTQISSLINFLDTKTLEIRFLHELGSVLQSSVDLDEVLSVALTAITAGKGFGMNRAFLLLVDKETQLLKGHLAIGPRSAEEAGRTWHELETGGYDLQRLAQLFREEHLTRERDKFNDILNQMVIPLDADDHVVARSLMERKPLLVSDAFNLSESNAAFARLLGTDTFLVQPLLARNHQVGVILADNFVNRRPITEEDLRTIESFTFAVAVAIERASLYEKIQDKVEMLHQANLQLQEQQEQLVRMEKMALVGRITSSIAHSIRNPLMVIGGFARNVLKSTTEYDPKRKSIETIVKQSQQLEGVLDEILTYSDSLYPTKDFWDVNQVVEVALREVRERNSAKDYTCNFYPLETAPQVYIDLKQTANCMRNIILSSISGLQKGLLEVTLTTEQDGVSVQIRDHNKQLSEDELEPLLTPFSEDSELGSGLNLALSRNILEKQNIPLLVSTSPEGGVTYTIKLPISKENS